MKTLISTFALILFIGIGNVSAQISKPKPQITLPQDRPVSTSNPNMNLIQIQRGLLADLTFVMTGTATVIEPPVRSGELPNSYTLAFSNRTMETREGSDYVQCNSDLNKNNNTSPHKFRVYVHKQPRSIMGHIDSNKIKVNWKGSRFGEVDFILKNVKVEYKKHGVIVTGTYSKNGILIGMSFTMHEAPGLI